jgi:hypothetical protein
MKNLIATMLLLGCGAAQAAPATDLECDKCIQTNEIAGGAITSGRLKKSAVTTGKIRSRAVTTGKIMDGAVTVEKVAPEIANAIGTSCLAGQAVVGMDESGNFVCEGVISPTPDRTDDMCALYQRLFDMALIGDLTVPEYCPPSTDVITARYMSFSAADNCFDALGSDGWTEASAFAFAVTQASDESSVVVTTNSNSCKNNEPYVGRCILPMIITGTGDAYLYIQDGLVPDESALCTAVIGGTWEAGSQFPSY